LVQDTYAQHSVLVNTFFIQMPTALVLKQIPYTYDCNCSNSLMG